MSNAAADGGAVVVVVVVVLVVVVLVVVGVLVLGVEAHDVDQGLGGEDVVAHGGEDLVGGVG
jgi:hypothetical protein